MRKAQSDFQERGSECEQRRESFSLAKKDTIFVGRQKTRDFGG